MAAAELMMAVEAELVVVAVETVETAGEAMAAAAYLRQCHQHPHYRHRVRRRRLQAAAEAAIVLATRKST